MKLNNKLYTFALSTFIIFTVLLNLVPITNDHFSSFLDHFFIGLLGLFTALLLFTLNISLTYLYAFINRNERRNKFVDFSKKLKSLEMLEAFEKEYHIPLNNDKNANQSSWNKDNPHSGKRVGTYLFNSEDHIRGSINT